MKRYHLITALLLIISALSSCSSGSTPEALCRISVTGAVSSLPGVAGEVKKGTVITFPEIKVDNHRYTASISNTPYSAGSTYTVQSDIAIYVETVHEYSSWLRQNEASHVRNCTVSGCNAAQHEKHIFLSDNKCRECGFESTRFVMSETLYTDTVAVMTSIIKGEQVRYVKAGTLGSEITALSFGSAVYSATSKVSLNSEELSVFKVENGNLMIVAPVLWFAIQDKLDITLDGNVWDLPSTTLQELTNYSVEWVSVSDNKSTISDNFIHTEFKDPKAGKLMTISFDGAPKFLTRFEAINEDGSADIGYRTERTAGKLEFYPFGEDEGSVTDSDLKSIICISAFSEAGYANLILTFSSGNPENPSSIANGETVRVTKPSVYAVVTNFMTGYATNSDYVGDVFSSSVTLTAEEGFSSSRSLTRGKTSPVVSRPSMDSETNVISWDNLYVYYGTKKKINATEVLDDDSVTVGRDYENGLLFMADDTISEEDRNMVLGILSLLYDEDNPLIDDDYIAREQKLLKISPSSDYLFPMTDSAGGSHELFTIVLYEYPNENTLGYFTSAIYNKNSDRNGCAVFYMNLKSLRAAAGENDDYNAAAESFLSTFAHEYAHYLEADYKYNISYHYYVDLIHFLEEGLADYVSLKQNDQFSKTDGVYNEEGGYLKDMFKDSSEYHPLSNTYQGSNYGVGAMFWSYIEEKYAAYGGVDVIASAAKQDSDTLTAIEKELKLPFEDIYEDFMLEVIAKVLDFDSFNGKARVLSFPIDYQVKRCFDDSGADTAVTSAECSFNLGPMSFMIKKYETSPVTLKFTSNSRDAKCYLIYK